MKAEYIQVHPKGKDTPPAKDPLKQHYKEGVLFCTYSLLTATVGAHV